MSIPDQDAAAHLRGPASVIRSSHSAPLIEEMSAELEVEVRAAAVRELEEKARKAEALAALKDQSDAVQRLAHA